MLGPLKIVLRKSCWDSSLDDALLTEPATLNLLYIQTVADIERGWILTSADTKQQLALMQVNFHLLVIRETRTLSILSSTKCICHAFDIFL